MVGDIAQRVELSQSALSQHLAHLRQEGLVGFTRGALVIAVGAYVALS